MALFSSASLLVASALLFSASAQSISTWHVVWIGGQSNSVGTNSQTSGYPTWPTTPRIQMYCGTGNSVRDSTSRHSGRNSTMRRSAPKACQRGTFAPASVPIYNEMNVAFSQTFANLLLPTLPADHGVVLVNTGVGGTGFQDGEWVVPNGPLAVNSVADVKALAAALPTALNGSYSFHSMLWHQGEEDAGDNRANYHADYCTYLVNDLAALIDFLRAGFPGAGPATPFVTGGLLPYWQHNVVNGTGDVPPALAAVNTSRVCTAHAFAPFTDFLPNSTTPNGDPKYRSGVSGDVIHFTAQQAVTMGYQYWAAYQRALLLPSVVPSSRTAGCPGKNVQPPVPSCSGAGSGGS